MPDAASPFPTAISHDDPALESVNCTRCQARDAELLYPLADYLYHTPGEFAARRCRRCGLIFLSPRPRPAALARYYPDAYAPYRTAIQDERNPLLRAMRRRRVRMRREFVERHTAQTPGRVLDIGASTGIFLDEMRRAGWETLGIELSETAATYARTRLGLEIICAELSQAGLPDSRFDLITLWDVLEHTYDPAATLQAIAQKLNAGGVVALTVPSWESLDRRLFGSYWVGFDAPRHLHVFTRPVLAEMVTAAGLAVVEDRTAFGGYFAFITSLRAWLRARLQPGLRLTLLERLMDLHGMRFVFEPLFVLMDWWGLGGVRVLVARKPSAPP
jgi:2-polyprenyl-3-methyl-5-hydroxy-6-metoxy-1,4-benzoquinol methylase